MSDCSDSDSDYNENEKILLDKYRKRKYDSDDENEEGVFNVGPDEDDSDDEDILADSDIEGQEGGDDLPNDKAWGRNKKAYYSSDYVNPNTYDEKELEFAEFEAVEGEKLEAEINQQFNLLNTGFEDEEDKEEQDLNEKETKLAKGEQELLSNLIHDFKEYICIYKEYMKPVVERYRNGEIENCLLTAFVECFSSLILNYSTNVLMLLLLKSNKTPIINHPILRRLEEYRLYIQKLLPEFETKMKTKIETLLGAKNKIGTSKSVEPKKKKLKLLQSLVLKKPVEKQKKKPQEEFEQKVKFAEKDEIHEISKEEDDQDEEEVDQEIAQSDQLEKRPITYQMQKNKGLTPHRKKEQRNPRVKHRNKYKKAKIRRKGAVREVRNEGRRYDGEISGIKTNVTKGIKIKV